MRRTAHWCLEHRKTVLLVWVVALVAVTIAKSAVGSDYHDSFKLSGTESADAQDLLQKSAPAAAGDSEQVVVSVDEGTVRATATRERIETMLNAVSKLPHVAAIVSPYSSTGAKQISKDGRIAFATINFDVEAPAVSTGQAKDFVDTARAAAGHGLTVEVGGQIAKSASQKPPSSTAIGVTAALIVMLLVFGSVLAAAMPLLTAGVALGTGTAVTGLLSNLIDMASFSSELSLLIGLGVGVDYALFIVTRMRQRIQRGVPVDEAIVDALDTSGRAVLFAGITVCIALLGLFALGISFLYGVAIAASIAVAFTVLAALTLLPALLGFVGLRVLSRRQRHALAEQAEVISAAGFWARWSKAIDRRPVAVAAAAIVVVAVIATPYFGMRLGSADSGSDPSDSTTRKAYDLLAEGFGAGYNGPLMLVAKYDDDRQRASFSKVAGAVARLPGVAGSTPVTTVPARGGAGGVALVSVYPKGSPQDESTTTLLDEIRNTTVPAAGAGTGLRVLVGGQTAIFEDFADVISSKLVLFIGIVVALSFVLLMAVFRSLVVPAMAAVMNLLTAAAGFGVITAIFQHGWGASLLGIDKTGPIEAFVPVMMFAIVFGLSMDYQVFLVTRIYEEWHRTRDNALAITRGLAATGRTITAAATIMVLVFAAFILGGERVIQLFGVGLASAVAIDALIIRSALVPALMRLFGRANWWLPATVDRFVPRLNVEGSVDDETREAAQDAGRRADVQTAPA
ncbi:MAG TPA: MMPL family transporter [Baekduia sp.]|nr:MMPL family transporter [Baekduia sp.]